MLRAALRVWLHKFREHSFISWMKECKCWHPLYQFSARLLGNYIHWKCYHLAARQQCIVHPCYFSSNKCPQVYYNYPKTPQHFLFLTPNHWTYFCACTILNYSVDISIPQFATTLISFWSGYWVRHWHTLSYLKKNKQVNPSPLKSKDFQKCQGYNIGQNCGGVGLCFLLLKKQNLFICTASLTI